MTGEITLRGEVLPIGGVKEKVLAARQAKIKMVILPRLNRRDVAQISARLVHDLTFRYVDTVEEVLEIGLLPPLEKRAQESEAASSPPAAREIAPAPRPRQTPPSLRS